MSSRSRVISLAVIAAIAFAVWATTKSRTPDGTAEAGTAPAAPAQPAPRALAAAATPVVVPVSSEAVSSEGQAIAKDRTQLPPPAPADTPPVQTARADAPRPEAERRCALAEGRRGGITTRAR